MRTFRKFKTPLCLLLSMVMLASVLAIAPISASAESGTVLALGRADGEVTFLTVDVKDLKSNIIIGSYAGEGDPNLEEYTSYEIFDERTDVISNWQPGECFTLTGYGSYDDYDYTNITYYSYVPEEGRDENHISINFTQAEEVDYPKSSSYWFIYTWSDGESGGEADEDIFKSYHDGNFVDMQILGVQKKEEIPTTDGKSEGKDIRFVTVVKTDFLKDSGVTDYGYILGRPNTSSIQNTSDFSNVIGFWNLEYTTDNSKGYVASCFKSSNTISGKYGDYEDSTTPYKYVTLAVNGTEQNDVTQTIAARFYVVKDGTTYYAKYKDKNDSEYDGCAANYDHLS